MLPRKPLLLLSVLAVAAPASPELVERVVAKVNGDIVTLSEFQARQVASVQQARISPVQVEEYLRENNSRILQDAIDERLLVQKAEDLGIRIRDDYIDNEVIANIKKENNITSDDQLREQLRREGMTLDDLRRNIKRSILRRQVLSREVEPRATATAADARAYYEAHKAEYTRHPTVRLQEIVVKDAEGRDAGAVAAELVRRARAGEDFAELARQHSDAPSRGSGGDLGVITQGDLAPSVEKVAFGLEPGAVSEPLPTGEGWRILRVVEKTPGAVVPFEEVQAQIQQQLSQERWEKAYEEYVEGLRKAAVIQVQVREVPLQVEVPEGTMLDAQEAVGGAPGGPPPAPAAPAAPLPASPAVPPPASPAGDDEFRTTPQASPERVAPPPATATPAPAPTPTPSPTPPLPPEGAR